MARNRDARVDNFVRTDMKNGCLYNIVGTFLTMHAVAVMNDFQGVLHPVWNAAMSVKKLLQKRYKLETLLTYTPILLPV